MEEWKQCGESTKCIYFVNNQGDVKSVRKSNKVEFILKGEIEQDGYIRYTINKKHYMAHRLVYIAFIEDIPTDLQIDHINRVKDDNRVENLRCVTCKVNNRNKSTFRSDILEDDPKERQRILDKTKIIDKEKNKVKCKEYYHKNKDKHRENNKQYRIDNREVIREKKKQYHINNRDSILEKRKVKYTCECGVTLNKGSKARHERTIKHQEFKKK